jgi:protein SCO1/2
MKSLSTIKGFVLAVFIIPILGFALFNFYEKRWGALPVLGDVKINNGVEEPHHISDFKLTNQDGIKVTTGSWANKIIVADFFFTHCPSICPKMTGQLKRVQQKFMTDPHVRINSFSVDPEDDSVVQLKKYATRFQINNEKWDLLTGSKKEIYVLARNSFMVVATDGDGGPADFIHSNKLVLVDTKKRIRGYYDGTNEKEVDQLLTDIKKLENE